MGASHGNFVKYPRTPHLFGSVGTSDDKHLNASQSQAFLDDDSLIVEEKIDGTNVGIHFADGDIQLQCRGHLITPGMHAQYDLFKQWVMVKRQILEERLRERYILFGEWAYAKHSIHYRKLPHYFFEFDIYDKSNAAFLTFDHRMELIRDCGIESVPILHRGALDVSRLEGLIGPSLFDSAFENPGNGRIDDRMEGLYLRTETAEYVSARAKFVRPEFVEKIKQSTHWQQQTLVPNELASNVDIWS